MVPDGPLISVPYKNIDHDCRWSHQAVHGYVLPDGSLRASLGHNIGSPTLSGPEYIIQPPRGTSWSKICLTSPCHTRTSTTAVGGYIRPSMDMSCLTEALERLWGVTLARMPTYQSRTRSLCGRKAVNLRPTLGDPSESSFSLANNTLSIRFPWRSINMFDLKCHGILDKEGAMRTCGGRSNDSLYILSSISCLS